MRAKTEYTAHVARDTRWTLVAFLMAGGGACADVDDFVGAAPVVDAAVAPVDSDPARAFQCVDPDPLKSKPAVKFQPADVLVLLDRSGSMDMAYGAGTRYQAVATALSDVVATYSPHVRFGFQEMPGRQGCGGALFGACCASPPLVDIADGNTQAMPAAIASALPMDGSTPTAASLRLAREYYQTLADGIDNRYVLLATDGTPNCTLVDTLSSGDALDAASAACVDALAEVNAMVALGVRVIVLGVGIGLADDPSGDATCLDALAHAGGVAASPGYPGFLTLSDSQQLHMAIEQLFGGIVRPPCSVHFSNKVASPLNMAVYFDGKEIPRSWVDGWQLDSPTHPQAVIITGTYCDQIQYFQVAQVEVGYSCTTCVEGQECD